MALGPVITDIPGLSLTAEDSKRLMHPAVGGVILFTRNYESKTQLKALVTELKNLRADEPLLITVDQEGGRVQRFRQDFKKLPALAHIGRFYDLQPEHALQIARAAGFVMAAELLMVGVDMSYAPVLDLQRDLSTVIGDRALHVEPKVVAILAKAFVAGMSEAGMSAVGKHFPGHGGVYEDSHHALPVDERKLDAILAEDIYPYTQLMNGELAGIMPAHIVYSEVDERPAGFSSIWLQDILRQKVGFNGVIFSDDLSMAGAEFAGDYVARAKMALNAGCDQLIVCNNAEGCDQILHHLDPALYMNRASELPNLYGMTGEHANHLSQGNVWELANQLLDQFNQIINEDGELELID